MVSSSLAAHFNCDSLFLVADDTKSSSKRFNLNNEIEQLDLPDNFVSSLLAISATYPDFDLNKSLFTDRDFYYLPRYFKRNRTSLEFTYSRIIRLFGFYESFLLKHNIKVIFSELIIGLDDSVLYAVAKSLNIKYISIRSSRVIPGAVFCDPYTELPLDFNVNDSDIHMFDLAVSSISSIAGRLKHIPPHYMKRTKRSISLSDTHYLYKFFVSLFDSRIPIFSARNTYSIARKLKFRLYKIFNSFTVRHFYSSLFVNKLPQNKSYFVFPLQYEPEATSSVRSYPFIDQISLIKDIVKILPPNVYLVVKEHLGNEGYRKYTDYLDLYYLPNVLLVSRSFDTSLLLSACEGVVTLNSTMGFEALCMGKPVASFGTGFWTPLSFVYSCSAVSDLNHFFVDYRNFDLSANFDEFSSYLAAYFTCVKNFVFLSETPTFLKKENCDVVSSLIFNEFLSDYYV